jgi:hypothetical protein
MWLRTTQRYWIVCPIVLLPKVRYCIPNGSPPVPILSQTNPVHITLSHPSKTHPNIIHPPMSCGHPRGLFSFGFPTNNLYAFLFIFNVFIACCFMLHFNVKYTVDFLSVCTVEHRIYHLCNIPVHWWSYAWTKRMFRSLFFCFIKAPWPSMLKKHSGDAGCFKKSFTTLKACINVFKGHVQCSELS